MEEVGINKKSHCGEGNGKVLSARSLGTLSALQLSLPWSLEPAADRLERGQVYRGRCGEEEGENAGAHTNQVFPLLALGSRDS